MASPRAKTPESNANAVVGRSVLLTAQKANQDAPEPKPNKGGRPIRPQRRVPKKTYFDGDDDDHDDGELVPDGSDIANESIPKTQTKADALGLLLETDLEMEEEFSTRPKKSLKAQLQPEAQAKPTTRPKKQQAKAKPVAAKAKPKSSVSRKAKEDQQIDRLPESTTDEYDIDASSPDTRHKITPTRSAQKAPAARAKAKGKPKKGGVIVSKKPVTEDVKTIIIDDNDSSSDYEDPEELVKAPQTKASDRKALQPLQPSQVQSRNRQESLINDRSARKPHLVSFDKNGPRNQGMTDSQLVKASQLHKQAASRASPASHDRVIEQTDDFIADVGDGLELQSIDMAYPEPLTSASDDSPGDVQHHIELKSLKPGHEFAGRMGNNTQNFTAPSPQQNNKLKLKDLQSHETATFAPHVNEPQPNCENEKQNVAQSLHGTRVHEHRNHEPATVAWPLSFKDSSADSPRRQKRHAGFDMTLAGEGDGQRYKRAKLLSDESAMMAAADNTGQFGWPDNQEVPKQSKDHDHDDPFRAGGGFGNGRTTTFSQRLLGLGPAQDKSKDPGFPLFEVQPPCHRGQGSGQDGGFNAVAQRMYRSLGTNTTTVQPHKPKAFSGGLPLSREYELRTKGWIDDEVSPLQKAGEPLEVGTGSPSPGGIVEALHSINNKLLRHLKGREAGLDDVVHEYMVNAGDIVQRIATRHTRERETVGRQFDTCRKDLINVWSGTRQDIHSMAEAVAAVDISAIMAAIRRDKSLERLRATQGA